MSEGNRFIGMTVAEIEAVSPPNQPPTAITTEPPSRPPVPTFTLAITMDAKAFGATHGTRMIELGKVLSDMTYAIERGKLHPGGTMTLKDGDGVTVGWATLGHDKP